MLLETLCFDVHKEFMAGNFSFQKTISKFSRLAIDQIHTSRTTKLSKALEQLKIY